MLLSFCTPDRSGKGGEGVPWPTHPGESMPGRGRALRAPRPSCAPFCSRPPPGAGPGPEAPRTKASVPGCGARGAEDGGGTASLLLWSFPEAWRDSGPGGAWIWDHLAGVPKSSRFQGRCGRYGAPGCQAAWPRRMRGVTSAGLGDTLKGGGWPLQLQVALSSGSVGSVVTPSIPFHPAHGLLEREWVGLGFRGACDGGGRRGAGFWA